MSIISLFEHKTPIEIGELLSSDFKQFYTQPTYQSAMV